LAGLAVKALANNVPDDTMATGAPGGGSGDDAAGSSAPKTKKTKQQAGVAQQQQLVETVKKYAGIIVTMKRVRRVRVVKQAAPACAVRGTFD
jgi:hypothetical protein